MAPINVLVIFYSCSGSTEKLALAAAVGAVQERANIRLRRLPDSSLECGDDLIRMRREYVPPAQADALWADAVVVAIDGKIGGCAETNATAFGRKVVRETRTFKSSM